MIPAIVSEARKTLPDQIYTPERNAAAQFESEMGNGRCAWFPPLSRLMQYRFIPYVAELWRLAETIDGSMEGR